MPALPYSTTGVEPAGDAAPAQVQLEQVADVRPAVGLEHRGQLGTGERRSWPSVVRAHRRRTGMPALERSMIPRRYSTGVPTLPLEPTNTYSLLSVAPPPVEKKNALTTLVSYSRMTHRGWRRSRRWWRPLGLEAPVDLRAGVVVDVERARRRVEALDGVAPGRDRLGAQRLVGHVDGISTGTTPRR